MPIIFFFALGDLDSRIRYIWTLCIAETTSRTGYVFEQAFFRINGYSSSSPLLFISERFCFSEG